jgi:hypothetical protein
MTSAKPSRDQKKPVDDHERSTEKTPPAPRVLLVDI